MQHTKRCASLFVECDGCSPGGPWFPHSLGRRWNARSVNAELLRRNDRGERGINARGNEWSGYRIHERCEPSHTRYQRLFSIIAAVSNLVCYETNSTPS